MACSCNYAWGIETCSTLIGRGTTAWLYISAEHMVSRHSLSDRVPIAAFPDYTDSAANRLLHEYSILCVLPTVTIPDKDTPKAKWTYDICTESQVGLTTIPIIPV